MKLILSKQITFSLLTFAAIFAGCNKAKEAINVASDTVNSPVGYWATEDSKLGQIGWKITENEFKKCTIALDSKKIAEEVGSIKIDGNRVIYVYSGKSDEYTATYHSDDNTLTEDQLLKLKYIRADDNKVRDLNNKGCHL